VNLVPNNTAEGVQLLIYIREKPVSNLGLHTNYRDVGFFTVSLTSSTRIPRCYLETGHDNLHAVLSQHSVLNNHCG